MAKRITFLLLTLFLATAWAMAQTIAPRCRVCGKKVSECPYKGKHNTSDEKHNEGNRKHADGKEAAGKSRPGMTSAKAKVPTIPSVLTGNGQRSIGNSLLLTYKGATIPRHLTVRGAVSASDIYEFHNNKQSRGMAEEADSRRKPREKCYRPSVSDCFDFSGLRSYTDNKHLQWSAGDTTAIDFTWLAEVPATTVIAPSEAQAIKIPARRYWVNSFPDTLVIGAKTKNVFSDRYNYNAKDERTDGSWNPHVGCIKAFLVDARNPYLKAVDGVLYSADGTRLVAYPGASARTEYTIPSSVKAIEPNAFGVSNNLKRIICSRSLSKKETDDIRRSCAYLEELAVPQQ